jgi:hypothetical protein
MNYSISFVSRAYSEKSSVYGTMIMSFMRKRHGSYFDCLKPNLSYIALNLRYQCLDAYTSPYKFHFSVNAYSLFLCSKPAGNRG